MKTNIPETTHNLDGISVDFGDPTFEQSIINAQTGKIQAIITGNRCGHAPSAPRFFTRPDQHKPRPPILESAIVRLKDVYRRPKKFFKKLAAFHPNHRQKRSERREAIAAVAQVLLHYLELSTLRVGFYRDSHQFRALDLAYIAKKAGVRFIRAKRAVKDLVRAGYIKVSRQFDKKEDGSFAGLPSIREISIQFFFDLGVDMQQLDFSRRWKRKEQAKALTKATHKRLSGLLSVAIELNGHKRAFHAMKKPHPPTQSIDKAKALINQALELHRLDPTRSPGDYLKALQKRQE